MIAAEIFKILLEDRWTTLMGSTVQFPVVQVLFTRCDVSLIMRTARCYLREHSAFNA